MNTDGAWAAWGVAAGILVLASVVCILTHFITETHYDGLNKITTPVGPIPLPMRILWIVTGVWIAPVAIRAFLMVLAS